MNILGKRGSIIGKEKKDPNKIPFKEYKEIMDKVITSEKAQKQMELFFAGKKASGPLKKSEIELLQSSSEYGAEMRKFCMLRAAERANIQVWDEVIENIDTTKNENLSKLPFRHANFSDNITKACEEVAKKATDKNTYLKYVHEISKKSAERFIKVREDLGFVMETLKGNPNFANDLESVQTNVERQIIGLIEEMNGNKDSSEQACEFADWVERNGKFSQVSGRYTISELARMTAMPGSIEAIKEMRKIQENRKLDRYILSGTEYTSEEIARSVELNGQARSEMNDEANVHKDNLHEKMGFDEYLVELKRMKEKEYQIQRECESHSIKAYSQSAKRQKDEDMKKSEEERREYDKINREFYDGMNKVFSRPDVAEYVAKAKQDFDKIQVEEIDFDEGRTKEKKDEKTKREGPSLDD